MKNNTYINIFIILFSILLFDSCRSTDSENSINNKLILSSVNINLVGTEYSNSKSTSSNIAEENKQNALITQVKSTFISPSKVLVAEMTSYPTLSNYSANTSSNIKTISAVPGNILSNGTKFRVVAYRKSNGNYQTHQDYIIGQNAIPMKLDNNAAYDIIAYSYGTNNLPTISSGEQSNINNASVSYDNVNKDFMYQKMTFTPVNDNNTLYITLRHKVAQITVIVKNGTSQNPGNNITSISNAIISPHYNEGIFSLSTGNMSGRTTKVNAAISFPTTNATSITATPVFINADTNENLAGTFSATIQINGASVQNVLAQDAFKINPEYKSNLTINLRSCKAKISPTITKDFMCHNLGADQSGDPFTPSASIHGAKYQWGKSVAGINQYDDQNNSGAITGWNTIMAPEDAWNDNSKTVNDPCPTGYRVPTQAEWQGVLDNNKVTSIGSFTESVTNYGSGVKLGDDLFLPAAGLRQDNNGTLRARGSFGIYWSSTKNTSTTSYFLSISSSNYINYSSRLYGHSIRCISQ